VLRVDGGAAVNDFLCQFQSDVLGVAVERPAVSETTALGAAYLAGMATGFWAGREEIVRNHRVERRFMPEMEETERERLYEQWLRAVERARAWVQ
jgi:glycerol kinase